MPLPQFVIIGAAKAATTWLTEVLRRQPDVFMPAPELHFFNRRWAEGLGWYEAQFAAARPGQLLGEKSASYLADPEVPGRLAAVLPQARLIVQLRNPVERAYSDYCMLLRRGEVSGDVARYLDADRTPEPRFLEHGLYARHLAAFAKHFPREQLKVLLYDDIRRDPQSVFAEVAAYLGLPNPVPPPIIASRVKDKETPLAPMALRRLPAPVKAMVRPLRGRAWFERARGLLARPERYPPLGDDLRRRMSAYYADEIGALEDMLGRRLDGWRQGGQPR